jgi:uncharacterized protein with NRDE domain
MCLCVLILPSKLNPHLVIVGNRDEAFERPTASLSCLDNGVYCGLDLVRGGTWLGVKPATATSPARFAYLTNFTEPRRFLKRGSPSRGQIPMDWLTTDATPEEFLSSLDFTDYNGMNIVIGIHYPDRHPDVFATANRGDIPNDPRFELCSWGAVGATYTLRFRTEDEQLAPFTVALCNGTLGDHWEKVDRCEEGAKNLTDFSDESLFALMEDQTPCSKVPTEEQLKFYEEEEVDEDEFSPIFMVPEMDRNRLFGTRTTSIMRIANDGNVFCNEKDFIQHINTCAASTII